MYERPSPRAPVRCITSIRPGCLAASASATAPVPSGDSSSTTSTLTFGCSHQLTDEDRQVLALVVGRHDHERRLQRHERRPSNRSDEICSETRPTSRITTLNTISRTEELVTCDCVKMVHTA